MTFSSAFPFLRLPLNLRQKIYSYLLSPHPEEDVTTINYTLEWPFLENPRNSTFTAHQLDHCRCPGRLPRDSNIRTTDHIYTRYTCQGPNVRFSAKSEEQWLLVAPNGPFNILRPASDLERQRRPSAAIVLASRQTYQEAAPFLYRDRNFLFLTGPCPRGRYQAYATRIWLSRLGPVARQHITSLSLICQPWEEDCRGTGLRSYASFAEYVVGRVPNCLNLYVTCSPDELPPHPLGTLFQRQGMRLFKKNVVEGGAIFKNLDPAILLENYGEQGEMTAPRSEHSDAGTRRSSDLDEDISENEVWAQHPRRKRFSFEAEEAEMDSDDDSKTLSLGDDWVIAGLSPTQSSVKSENDSWEMV